MKQKHKVLKSPIGSVHGDEEARSLGSSSSEEEPLRRIRETRTTPHKANDFKVKIPKSEGKLDPKEFLDWLNTIECIFDYKDIPKDKKVKLVAVKLQNYVSLYGQIFGPSEP